MNNALYELCKNTRIKDILLTIKRLFDINFPVILISDLFNLNEETILKLKNIFYNPDDYVNSKDTNDIRNSIEKNSGG